MCRVAGSAEFYVVCRVRYWLLGIKCPLLLLTRPTTLVCVCAPAPPRLPATTELEPAKGDSDVKR